MSVRCKQCGKTYESAPAQCACGNADPTLWEALAAPAAPQPENGYAQPQDPAPQQSADWQQPQDPAPQQPAPQQPLYGQEGYQPPVPPQNNGGGKKKKTVVIAVIAAIALVGLAVGGYFLYQHFWGDNPSSQSENKDGDKKSNKDKDETVSDRNGQTEEAGDRTADVTTDVNAGDETTAAQTENTADVTAPDATPTTTAPSTPTTPTEPATPTNPSTPTNPTNPTNPSTPTPSADGTVTFHNVIITIPEGYEQTESEDPDSLAFANESGFSYFQIAYNEGTQADWEEILANTDDIQNMMGLEETGVTINVKENKKYKIDGHDAIYYVIEGTMDEMPLFAIDFNLLFLRLDDGMMMIMGGGLGGGDEITEAFNSIRIK